MERTLSIKTHTFNELKEQNPDLSDKEIAALWELEGRVYWVLRYRAMKELHNVCRDALLDPQFDRKFKAELTLDHIMPIEKKIREIEENNAELLAEEIYF